MNVPYHLDLGRYSPCAQFVGKVNILFSVYASLLSPMEQAAEAWRTKKVQLSRHNLLNLMELSRISGRQRAVEFEFFFMTDFY